MTENEIKMRLEVLKDWVGNASLTRQDFQNAIDEANKILDEIQQYREIGTVKEIKIREGQFARLSEGYLHDLGILREYQSIGTVEELKALKEKAEPKKVTGLYHNICPTCSWVVSHNNKYCESCGQKLDWE